jgi:hypothetical protein
MLNAVAGLVMAVSVVGCIVVPTTVIGQPKSVEDVLHEDNACTVAQSVLRRKVDAMRTPDQRKDARKLEKDWPCYDALPGHPTEDEKRAYIERISRFAKIAEATHQVPAAAIAAMALVEAGYGYTRTALQAKNLYGWKIHKQDRKTIGKWFVLSCQDTTGEHGKADENRCYRVFATEEESVDFVASRLANSFNKNYRRAANGYRRDTLAGLPTIERVQNWVVGIANPYNWRPTAYARSICRLMRDPINGSELVNADSNLYQLSALPGEVLSLDNVSKKQRNCDSITVM